LEKKEKKKEINIFLKIFFKNKRKIKILIILKNGKL